MTHLEATDLAVRILRVFSGPPADVWEEVLVDLHAGQAGTALARLTREHQNRWLSVAEFTAKYNSLSIAAPTPAPKPDHDGIGFVEYLERLTKRAMHNADAAEELATWDRWLSRQASA